jgi:intracellular septation protein
MTGESCLAPTAFEVPMKLLCEFLFLAIFFAVFKVYGIYPAIASAIVLYGSQLGFMYLKNKRVEKIQLVTFLIVLVLGGASLIFQNEMFFKWKPSVIYWALAIAIVAAQAIRHQSSLQTFLAQSIELPVRIWYQLDYVWAGFFTLLGALNIVIAYHFPTSVWVYFKLFGTLGFFVLFILFQMLWLSRYAKSH